MEELRRQFLEKWNIEKIKSMTLEEYTSIKSKGERDDFTFWIEIKMKEIIGFGGGSSEKFGIYLRGNPNTKIDPSNKRKTDGEYTWHEKYGDSKDEAFQTIKDIIISIIQHTKNQEFEKIDTIGLGTGYKWTIAYHYAPNDTLLKIVSKNAFQFLSKIYFDGKYTKISEIQKALISRKPKNITLDDYSTQLFDTQKRYDDFRNWLPEQTNNRKRNFTTSEAEEFAKYFYKAPPNGINESKNIFEISDINELETIKQSLKYEENNPILYDVNQKQGNGKPSQALHHYIKFLNGNINPVEQRLSKNDNKKQENNMTIANTPLNQILYGPPGTGKTYSTVKYALKILGAEDREDEIKSIGQLKEEFKEQVEFVTFHQSFSYEDFVEGLKASTTDDEKITYNVESGIFKQICEKAKENLANSQNAKKKKIDVKLLLNDFADHIESKNINNEEVLLKSKDTYFGEISRKADETFKTFTTKGNVNNQKLTEEVIIRNYQSFYDNAIKEYKDIKPTYKSKRTYHGNAPCYFALFERMKEFQEKEFQDKNIDYLIKDEDSIKKPYVLIIDEINRGNISRIFGELITLIEPNKRAGADEEISVQLPYSKSKKLFSVPKNLYIIGTMNTADRSLALMDTALRRRFDFIEMMPNPNLDEISRNCEGVDLQELLKKINKRIEILYDREHTIGHSFLMDVNTLPELRKAFKNKILPLLEEYFYDDFAKIKLVLNDTKDDGCFYKKTKEKLGKFEKIIYRKQTIDSLEKDAFIQICEKPTTKDE